MTDPNRSTRIIRPALVAFLIALLAAGCETTDKWYRGEPEVAVTGPPAIPPSFLYTDFEPLANWLDEERFRVEYRNMTPSLIFEQLPIDDIRYETENLPPDTEFFDLKSSSISRREILYRVAQNWGLTMTIEEENGEPQRVRVVGQGEQMTNKVNFPPAPESDIPGGVGF